MIVLHCSAFATVNAWFPSFRCHSAVGFFSAMCEVDVEDLFMFAELLVKAFTKLHFTVIVEDNLTHDALVQRMKTESCRDHRQYKCFVCCILSHGAIGEIYGTDGITVSIKDLTVHFKGASCPSLREKPKIFIVQACQGTEKQAGIKRMWYSLCYIHT